MPEDAARQIFKQIACGVRDIHAKGIVHRDLKLLNFLVSVLPSSDTPTVKITDFGMAVKLEKGHYVRKVAGTIGFMPPEIISNEPSDFKVDIWSLGVTLYALLNC